MNYLELRKELPSNLTTMVVALGGWIDAGEAATRALRYLVRRLPGEHLAHIDNEEFFDFSAVRPMVRSNPDGTRTLRWPDNDFFVWQRPNDDTGLLLLRGTEPSLKWRTYSTLVLDLAERCGVRSIVTVGAVLASVPHTRPPLIRGTSTDPEWESTLREWGILRQRRPSYQGPTGIATILREAAEKRGMRYLSLMGQTPHYLQTTSNPSVSLALLSYVSRLLDLELNTSRLAKNAEDFVTQADQVLAENKEVQAYVGQLEKEYDDAIGDQGAPLIQEAIDPGKLVEELEEFLRSEREEEKDT